MSATLSKRHLISLVGGEFIKLDGTFTDNPDAVAHLRGLK
jgi:hypothetical protein